MFKKILDKLFPSVEFVTLDLKPIKQKKQTNEEPVELDRNYHHYVITEHTQKRMVERKISYSEINLALKYGEETTDGIILRMTHLPDSELSQMSNADLKAITYLLPLTVILNKKEKIIKTVYPSTKTYLKDVVVKDLVRKGIDNRYTRKIKGKCLDEMKQKKKLSKKLRPYKELDYDY